MKMTFSALAIAVALIASAGVASATPNTEVDTEWENVFEPRN